jgi:hypothetical protein
LVKDYGEISRVEGNDARLGQVFLNLVINAAQAIRDGDAEHNTIRVVTRTDNEGRVVAEVCDTGPGIPAPTLARLFEPFFTTKPVGIGTGLGLSICRRIVAEHGGTIEVESAVGRGTTFRVTLPATHLSERVLTPPKAKVRRSPVPSGRVLVVDDEPLIHAVVRRTLSSHHDVTSPADAAALELLARGEEFDVILCDIQGPQSAHRQALRRRSPPRRDRRAHPNLAPQLSPRSAAPAPAKLFHSWLQGSAT